MLKTKIKALFLCTFITFISLSSNIFANSMPTADPALLLKLENFEDLFEKDLDKQYQVDWDFSIIYDNGKVNIIMEYDGDDQVALKQISPDNLKNLLTSISQEILKIIGQDVEISGIIVNDNSFEVQKAFVYKDGKLYIE